MFSLGAKEKQLESNIITGLDVDWPVWEVKELPFDEVLEPFLNPALKVFFRKFVPTRKRKKIGKYLLPLQGSSLDLVQEYSDVLVQIIESDLRRYQPK